MELTDKLVNVRRATRLLAAYYRRVLDILGLVDSTLESRAKLQLKFLRWDGTHHWRVGQQTTAVVGRWGWDFLPIQDATFRWTTRGEKAPGSCPSVSVNVWHQTDDGYDDGQAGEPDPALFAPAAQTDTHVYVYVYGVTGATLSHRWNEIEKLSDSVLNGEHLWDGEVHELQTDALDEADPGTRIRYVGWRVPVARLETEDDVEARILAPLRTALDQIVAANPA